jgi:hypothetical protein
MSSRATSTLQGQCPSCIGRQCAVDRAGARATDSCKEHLIQAGKRQPKRRIGTLGHSGLQSDRLFKSLSVIRGRMSPSSNFLEAMVRIVSL